MSHSPTAAKTSPEDMGFAQKDLLRRFSNVLFEHHPGPPTKLRPPLIKKSKLKVGSL